MFIFFFFFSYAIIIHGYETPSNVYKKNICIMYIHVFTEIGSQLKGFIFTDIFIGKYVNETIV